MVFTFLGFVVLEFCAQNASAELAVSGLRPAIGTPRCNPGCLGMPNFQFRLSNANQVLETETESLGSIDEAAEFAYRIAQGLKSQGWADEDEDVQLAVFDHKGMELFRLLVF